MNCFLRLCGLLLVFAFCVIGANFVMDLLNFVLDPRVRAS